MTQLERQLLNWIEENPLISQQELADKAGITRSSVAVHISNLMKKGYITGKGYIVHTAPYVTVVGGVNMDIGGWPGEVLVMQDSNPGVVRMSLGGVGRNIAHNMALLGMDVRMLTVFGDDINAQKIAASCGELGIDISQSPIIPEGRTSTYLFITDEKGDMALAVSDMEIYKHMTPQMLSQRQTLLNASQAVVLDTNIPAESIQYLVDHCTAPLFADPVSTAKAVKLKPVLGRIPRPSRRSSRRKTARPTDPEYIRTSDHPFRCAGIPAASGGVPPVVKIQSSLTRKSPRAAASARRCFSAVWASSSSPMIWLDTRKPFGVRCQRPFSRTA